MEAVGLRLIEAAERHGLAGLLLLIGTFGLVTLTLGTVYLVLRAGGRASRRLDRILDRLESNLTKERDDDER